MTLIENEMLLRELRSKHFEVFLQRLQLADPESLTDDAEIIYSTALAFRLVAQRVWKASHKPWGQPVDVACIMQQFDDAIEAIKQAGAAE